MSKLPLTKKQYETLSYLQEYKQRHGYMPTISEICSHFGLTSYASGDSRLSYLEEKGYILRYRNKPRGLEILMTC